MTESIPKKLEIFLYDYPQPQKQQEDFGFVEKEIDPLQILSQVIVESLTTEKLKGTPEWTGAGSIYEGTTVVGDSSGATLETTSFKYGAYIEYFPGQNKGKINLFQQKKL
ncbi:MAG: hypothetical protein ACE5KO_01345 [Candidatus Bathyarchaeia archaeon]